MTEQDAQFQTPTDVCNYMSSFLPANAGSILEPTPGMGNLVNAIKYKGRVTAPDNFFAMEFQRFDWIVMNPPFTPIKVGYDILYRCMEMSDNIIALMPWLTIINSHKRTRDILSFGLVSISHLPRNVFKGSRVQTCILHMKKDWAQSSIFKAWNW